MSNRQNKDRKPITIYRMSDHSWFRIIIDDFILDIDPGYTGSFDLNLVPIIKNTGKSNIILISHHHFDHIQNDAIDWISDKNTKVFAAPLCRQVYEKPFTSLNPGEHIKEGPLSVDVINAYNTPSGRSTKKFHYKGEGNGYVIHLGKWALYFAGDTDVIPDMGSLTDIDIAFLPIGGTYVMDYQEAIQATEIIKPKYVILMHELGTDPRLFEKAKKIDEVKTVLIKTKENITFK
jgi:L-ascorbate metabolism protein UlaG (beta-lactamase superfamily)